MLSAVIILAVSSNWIHGVNAVGCYTPNGVDRNTQLGYGNLEGYAPCSASATHSMCCAWGSARTNSNTADTCLPNGLCRGPDPSLTWRESCTDPTWQAPECIKLFVNGTGLNDDLTQSPASDSDLTDVTVTECDNGSFCYGDNNRACCQQEQGVFINAQGMQTSIDPSATTSSTSSIASSTTSPTTSVSPTTTPVPSNGGLSTAAQAGIGAGVGVAALAAAIVAGCWYVRRRKKKQQQTQELIPPPAETKYFDAPPQDQRINEPHFDAAPQEMDSSGPGKMHREAKGPTGLVEME